MTADERYALRKLRDRLEDGEDRKLLRKAVNYMAALENRMTAIRVHARSIANEAAVHTASNTKQDDYEGED